MYFLPCSSYYVINKVSEISNLYTDDLQYNIQLNRNQFGKLFVGNHQDIMEIKEEKYKFFFFISNATGRIWTCSKTTRYIIENIHFEVKGCLILED